MTLKNYPVATGANVLRLVPACVRGTGRRAAPRTPAALVGHGFSEETPADVGARGPVTSYLFLRYRPRGFKVGAEVLSVGLHDIRHVKRESSSS
jgi:hypothetical protein